MEFSTKQKGFTLIEMVVTIGLISILVVLVSVFLVQSIRSYSVKSKSIRLEENAASAMREFERSARAASKIITATENEFVFYRYFDLTSPEPKQVRYFIDGNEFKVGITEPVGTSPNVTYPSNNEEIALLIADVTNPDRLFDYYDGANVLLEFPATISSIKAASLNISLDDDPNKPPEPITQITKVTFRNLKDNL